MRGNPTIGADHVIFKNRTDAGNTLASLLASYATSSVLILGLARGGIAVACAIAKKLGIPFDVLVVKKVSSPYSKEFAIGAEAPDNVSVIHWADAHRAGADEDYVHRQLSIIATDIRHRMSTYRKGRKPLSVRDKTVLFVDDGAATGATMEAAIVWARKKGATQVIIALPVSSTDAYARISPEADETYVLQNEQRLAAVGDYYETFTQVSDEDVIRLLRERA